MISAAASPWVRTTIQARSGFASSGAKRWKVWASSTAMMVQVRNALDLADGVDVALQRVEDRVAPLRSRYQRTTSSGGESPSLSSVRVCVLPLYQRMPAVSGISNSNSRCWPTSAVGASRSAASRAAVSAGWAGAVRRTSVAADREQVLSATYVEAIAGNRG